jgi:UDP:flavonoid glycosyltransferase YjiC (YdhE family)
MARCEALGIAVRLDPTTVTSEDIHTAVMGALEQPSHRRAAEALHDEIAAMPDSAHAVARLELLARQS